MCNGTIMDKLISFSIPLMLSGILQLMFNAVDIVVVGRFSGSQSLAAVGSTTALINVFTNLFIGISLGTNVLAARFYGAGKTKEKGPDAAVTDGHCEGENMTEKEIQEHLCKELLKKIVDNGQNYTEKMKSDLKEIIDLGKSPEEICEATLAYFAMCRWQ